MVHLSQSTFASLWKIVDTENAGFLSFKQISQLVRLIGYAQTDEPNISRTLLRKPGPTCRIDGWTVPLGKKFEKPCSEEEEILVKAIMRESDPEGLGIIEGLKAKPLLRRSGLPNETLARIWEIVDESKRGFLVADDLKRILRLISCAQRNLPLHSRQYENPCPLPDLDDSFANDAVIRPPITPLSNGPPAFPVPALTSPNTFVLPTNHNRSISLPTRPPNDPLPELTDKQKKAFIKIFDRQQPVNGLITGEQGRTIFNRSKLPPVILGQIWELADTESKGSLTRSQFIIAMYLIKLVMDQKTTQLPASIPDWLRVEATKEPKATPTPTVTVYAPPEGPPPNHGRSLSQPASRPQLSILDWDNEALNVPTRAASSSPPRGMPSPSPPAQYLADYLNRPVPPPPLPQRLSSDEAPPPYAEFERPSVVS